MDEWTGYNPLRTEYPHLEQRKSNDGNAFIDLHVHIINLKGWLRGIRHHCSKERLQGYLDEYYFRYNRRNNMDTIFDLLMKRMVYNEQIRTETMLTYPFDSKVVCRILCKLQLRLNLASFFKVNIKLVYNLAPVSDRHCPFPLNIRYREEYSL